jgi:hypothetical protein
MSGFLEKRNAKLAAKEHGGRTTEEFALAFPELASMLNGIVDAKGAEILPQFTLTLWASERGIGFVLRQKAARDKKCEAYFGTIAGATDIARAVEDCLSRGEVDLKVDTGAKF